jgi:type VI secretion system (T6SS) Tli4-like immunity protein
MDLVDQCVGRFCLRLPASMKRTSDEEKVQGVKLEEVAWDKSAKDPWEHEWLERLRKIEAMKSKREIPTAAYGEILDQLMIKPGQLKAVFFCPSASKKRTALGAIYNAGSSGLWLEILVSEQRKQEAAARIAEIAAAYRPDEPGRPRPKGAFHLLHGAIAAPFKLSEEASVRFKGGPLDLELSFELETTSEPDDRSLMQKFANMMETSGVAAMGAGLRPIRSKSRKVAGLSGEEIILLGQQDDDGSLFFQWRTPGEPDSGKHPAMNLVLRGTDAQKDEKIAFWDATLETVKPA